MSPTAEQSAPMGMEDYGELLSVETSVLRTLCLTVNATGSELKYKILDTLSEDDFYFPVNKAIFTVVNDLHRRGDYIVYTNLEEEIQRRSVDIPEDLFIEDFFRGELPELTELSKWIAKLKERSRGSVRVEGAREARPSKAPASAAVPGASVTQIRSASESRKAAAKKTTKTNQTPPPRKPAAAKPKGPVLSSEGDEWADYLEQLASKQGRSLETGFKGIDEGAGGLAPGLMLVADADRERCSCFLKQLTDQIALQSKARCLFVSFETSKELLRIRTLSRLSGVPAKDIERGRLKKDSAEWESVERNGRKAAGWLKRVFVVEAGSGTNLDLIRKLAKQLADASEDAGSLVVIDSLEKLGHQLTELKELSDALDILVIAATTKENLLSASDADYSARCTDATGGRVDLDLSRGDAPAATVRFKYDPGIYKFAEQ